MTTQQYRYEDNAEDCKVPGWKCRGCGKAYYIKDIAQKCCAVDFPCMYTDCQNRISRSKTTHPVVCDSCRHKKLWERFLALDEVDWDGKTPMVGFDDDRYFYSVEDVLEYLVDIDDDEPDLDPSERIDLEQLMLVLCEPANPVFSMDDYLESKDFNNDDQPYPDATSVEDVVNDYLQNKLVKTWFPGDKRIRVASIGIARDENGEWRYS